MIVFLCGVTVALDVADNFGIYLAGSIETEGCLDPFVLKVAVDSLGHTDYLNVCAICLIIFGEDGCIGVGIVASDNYKSLDIKLLKHFQTGIKLFGSLKFCTSGTDDVKTAGVAIFFDVTGCEFHILMIDEAGGTHEEAIETTFLVEALDAVEDAADDIVAAGSLSAGKNNAYVERLFNALGLVVFYEFYYRKAISIGEQ